MAPERILGPLSPQAGDSVPVGPSPAAARDPAVKMPDVEQLTGDTVAIPYPPAVSNLLTKSMTYGQRSTQTFRAGCGVIAFDC